MRYFGSTISGRICLQFLHRGWLPAYGKYFNINIANCISSRCLNVGNIYNNFDVTTLYRAPARCENKNASHALCAAVKPYLALCGREWNEHPKSTCFIVDRWSVVGSSLSLKPILSGLSRWTIFIGHIQKHNFWGAWAQSVRWNMLYARDIVLDFVWLLYNLTFFEQLRHLLVLCQVSILFSVWCVGLLPSRKRRMNSLSL